jgi:hypothetical protein
MIYEHSRTWVALIVSVIVGFVAGLGFAWFVSPVEYTSVEPSELAPQFRATYLQLVAASFAFENDWTRADFRLQVLRDDPQTTARLVRDVTERAIAEGRPAPMLRALSKLSDKLGVRTAAMIVYLATPVPTMPVAAAPTPFRPPPTFAPTASPAPTLAPIDTPTPRPTPTPTPLPPPLHVLMGRERICEAGSAQIRVVVEDETRRGIAGVEVWVTWESGADRFVTGLKPESGSGYGDFDMQTGRVYAVAVAESALPVVTGLQTAPCPSPDPAQAIFASWQLTFRPVAIQATPTSTVTLTPTATLKP